MTLVDTDTGEVVSRSLDECESVIRRGLLESSSALREIRDGRLYKQADFDSFDAYCRERLGIGRDMADRTISAGEVIAELPTMVSSSLNERQARALAPLRHDPEAMADVLRLATAEAEAAGSKLTADRIKDAVDKVTQTQPERVGVRADSDAAPGEPEPCESAPAPILDTGEAADREAAEGALSALSTSPVSSTEPLPVEPAEPTADPVAVIDNAVAALRQLDGDEDAQTCVERDTWEYALRHIADHPREPDLSDIACAALRTQTVHFNRH